VAGAHIFSHGFRPSFDCFRFRCSLFLLGGHLFLTGFSIGVCLFSPGFSIGVCLFSFGV
jgi:hypothetical protein